MSKLRMTLLEMDDNKKKFNYSKNVPILISKLLNILGTAQILWKHILTKTATSTIQ